MKMKGEGKCPFLQAQCMKEECEMWVQEVVIEATKNEEKKTFTIPARCGLVRGGKGRQ
jgi:hypothetical protein